MHSSVNATQQSLTCMQKWNVTLISQSSYDINQLFLPLNFIN